MKTVLEDHGIVKGILWWPVITGRLNGVFLQSWPGVLALAIMSFPCTYYIIEQTSVINNLYPRIQWSMLFCCTSMKDLGEEEEKLIQPISFKRLNC